MSEHKKRLELPGIEVWCILLNAAHVARASERRKPWWSFASRVFGVGSNSGAELAKRAGFDPDRIVKDEPGA